MSSERQKSWPGGNLLSKIEQQSKLHFHTSHQQSELKAKHLKFVLVPAVNQHLLKSLPPLDFMRKIGGSCLMMMRDLRWCLRWWQLWCLRWWRLKNLKCHITRLTGSLHHYNNFKPLPGHFDHHRFIEITTNTLFNLHPSSDTKSKQPPA